MGHAGAIVSGSSGTAAAKRTALEQVGVRVGQTPSETAALMAAVMQRARRLRPDASAGVGDAHAGQERGRPARSEMQPLRSCRQL